MWSSFLYRLKALWKRVEAVKIRESAQDAQLLLWVVRTAFDICSPAHVCFLSSTGSAWVCQSPGQPLSSSVGSNQAALVLNRTARKASGLSCVSAMILMIGCFTLLLDIVVTSSCRRI